MSGSCVAGLPVRLGRPPVVCMVTDRLRLDPPGDESLVQQVRAAARGGVDLIQVRERDMDGLALFRLVRRCLTAVRASGARLLVNDRVDVALAAGAHGVHLRHDSVPAHRVRAIAPTGFLVGRSVHETDDVTRSAAGGALDYLIFGTVFQTASKPGREAAGLERLAQTAAISAVPVLGVGGMTVDRMAAVAGAGASGIAAIGLFAGAAAEDIALVVRHAHRAFDRGEGVP